MDMNWKKSSENKPVGVIGIGSFGTAISNLLAEKTMCWFTPEMRQ